jgi:hypothetical protein
MIALFLCSYGPFAMVGACWRVKLRLYFEWTKVGRKNTLFDCSLPLIPISSSRCGTAFFVWGQLYDLLAEALKPAFLVAVTRLNTYILDKRRRFMDLVAALVVFDVESPLQIWCRRY